MIYRALVDLAKREGLLADTAYEPKEVHFLIHLGANGRYLSHEAPRLPQVLDKKGKPRGKPQPPKRPIPRRSDRTVQDQAEFLVDKAEYCFGVDPLQLRDAETLATRRDLFRDAVNTAAAAVPSSAGLQAMLGFLGNELPAELRGLLLSGTTGAEKGSLAGALFAFAYDPQGGVNCVHDEPAVKSYFRGLLLGRSDVLIGQCLVTGATNVALARLHAKPKGIPPRGKTKGGVPLTSVNCEAFVSYDLGGIGSAPVGEDANIAVEFALNRLLDTAYPRPDGSVFPRRHEVISPDTVVAYWAKEDANLDFIHEVEESDPEKVGAMLHHPAAGCPAPLEDPTAFYALILSGAQGRAVVRGLIETTVKDIAANVDRYRTEAAIVRPYEDVAGSYPLAVLRQALVPRGDLRLLPAAFATDLYLSILNGRPFRGALVETIVRRNRAALFPMNPKSGKPDPVPLAARCSLLKAYFIRNCEENISMALDEARTDPPYLLGRLLAALDDIQRSALGNVNATIVDRFFGSASATPQSVFPTLIRRNQHHLAKLRREKPGMAVNSDKLLQEILGGLSAFPSVLTLKQQALFALGFYHQRQFFFTKS
jgi:CRISPR-associated protein Csd1